MRQVGRALAAVSVVAACLAAPSMATRAAGATVSVVRTTALLDERLTPQPDLRFAPGGSAVAQTIEVNDGIVYQRIDGFGAAITDTSAWLIERQLGPAARAGLMSQLFSPYDGIGISFIRVPMGASDFTHDVTPYSYDDLPDGQSDPALRHFSIAHDTAYIIPVLRQALALNPRLTIMANPWSPPAWMKTNGRLENAANGGHLLRSAYGPLARYFVQFITGYSRLGIPIDLVTPQNEPLQPTPSYPGLSLSPAEEATFVAGYLGPALARARLSTRILGYDYWWDTVSTKNYPFVLMANPQASRYLAGTAWHCYVGNPAVMSEMHDRYPAKDNYETECSSGIAPGPVSELVIASMRNWARGVLLWNLALDQHGGPHQGHGCDTCYAPVTINTANGGISFTSDYYELGQFSRFVRPGAVRISSTTFVVDRSHHYASAGLDDVAFKNPDGTIALVVYNNSPVVQPFGVRWHGASFSDSLPAGATVTFTWS